MTAPCRITSSHGVGIRTLLAGAIALLSAAAWTNGAVGAETIRVGKSSDIAFTFIPVDVGMIYATKDAAEHRPDAVRAFLKGWYESVDFMATHKPETVAIAQTVTHFSAPVQDTQYDQVMPSMSRDGTFPADAVATVEQSFADLGLLTEKPDAMKYLTTRFLPPRR